MSEDLVIDLLNALQELVAEAAEAVIMLGNRDDYGPLYMNEQSIALDVALEKVLPLVEAVKRTVEW